MNIEILEELIDSIEDTNLSSIMELIVEAVRDFPLFGMNDTELYFDEVKKIIGLDKITAVSIKEYLKLHQKEENENDIWVGSSLNIFLEAFYLMDLNRISFEEMHNKIKKMS